MSVTRIEEIVTVVSSEAIESRISGPLTWHTLASEPLKNGEHSLTNPLLTRYVLGHEVGISGGYYVPTETELRRAILTLGDGKPYTRPYTNPTELIEKAEAAKAC